MDSLEQLSSATNEMLRFDGGMVNIQELIRVMAESLVNEIMDAQVEDACADGSQRNGYRERWLTTSVGVINLRAPKLRRGTCFPDDLLVRYSRVDRAVIAAVSETVTSGVSTRKVARVASALGIERMSASQVSRICESLDATVEDRQSRDLSDAVFPYVWLDATYVKCRDEGLRRAIKEVFPGAACQRCIVHLMRNAASCAPARQKRAAVLAILYATFDERDLDLVRKLCHLACESIAGISPKAGELLEDAEADALAYLDFPYARHRRLRTNNVQERANRELKRRSRVVQVFPSRTSLVRMLGAVFAEMDEDWASRRWFTEESVLRAYSGKASAPAPSYQGDTKTHAARIIELVMADNPISRKAAWPMA